MAKNKKCKKCGHLYINSCPSCAKRGKNNPMFGVSLSRHGKNNSNYKDGRTLVDKRCVDCNKRVSDYRVIRCQSCAVKYLYKIGVLNSKGKHNSRFGKLVTEESRRKMNISHGGNGLFKHERKRCIDCNKRINYRATRCPSCSVKEQHRNNIFNYNRSPNKPESLLNFLLTIILPKEYKYVGNDKIVIDTFNPDFINCNGQKKIIEMYGDYWHKRDEVVERDKRRLKAYKEYGYETLIIWEKELKDPEMVIAKLMEFSL